MLEALAGLALIALIVTVVRLRSTVLRLERELGGLRAFVLENLPIGTTAPAASLETASPPLEVAEEIAQTVEAEEPVADEGESSGPWSATSEPEPAVATLEPARPDIETALGTRWAVWVGGLALALGGLFLVRYSIEAGIFGPGVRLTMAALFGIALVGGGEFIRRTGYEAPVQGAAGAYLPGILTAAGAFTLFGAVYAAHGIYGFIGPGVAFPLMGVIGVATIAAALVHGQALAGVGLLGALLTPILVASEAPNAWALFGYLAIVLAATGVIARMRDWSLLMAAALAGTGIWTVLYLANADDAGLLVVTLFNAVTLAVLTSVWLARRDDQSASGVFAAVDWPSIVPALFVGISAGMLFLLPEHYQRGGAAFGGLIVAAMVGAAFWRPRALALLHAAGIGSVLIYTSILPVMTLYLDLFLVDLTVESANPVAAGADYVYLGSALGSGFIAAGLWRSKASVASDAFRSASWAGWGVATPLVILLSIWLAFGNPERDLVHALVAALLAGVFAVAGEWIARAERPPLSGGAAVSFWLGGATLAFLLLLHMAFGPGLTTVLAGAAAILPALATRWRSYPVLGWIAVGAALAVLVRVALDPTVVGSAFLGRTPVFNALLPGYGIPALAFGFAAWQLARTTGGRPRLVMEAVAALFALLTVAMLVRHAMNGGVIDAGAPSLAEQAIYTLIALGAGAILVAIDTRSPSPVMRIGSLAAAVVSVAVIAIQHFALLNPVFTNESTGGITFFNLLFLAYLLPAAAAGALALYARAKRPRWYAAMLGLTASVLAFVYATLSVRRLFNGEFIGLYKGMSQAETYSYSALWLALGVGLLVLGVRLKSHVLRIASAVLIAIAVAKVFLFDMSELEGILRALSFIGLGAVLIGIGLFYQKLLTRSKQG